MRRVDVALERLHPVAFLHPQGHMHLLGRDEVPFEIGQRRQVLLFRAHVGPNDAVALAARISLEPDIVLETAAGRLGGHVRHAPGDIKFPAVIDTAQPALLVAGECQRRAPMRTSVVKEADRIVRGPKGDEIFAKQSNALWAAIRHQILRQQEGDPEQPEELSHAGTGTNPHQHLVIVTRQHRTSPSELILPSWSSGSPPSRVRPGRGDEEARLGDRSAQSTNRAHTTPAAVGERAAAFRCAIVQR